MEIERKFWIDSFPEGLEELVHMETEQGYLCIAPAEVRIRARKDCGTGEIEYRLCIKSLGDMVRHEVETPLEHGQYEELKSMLDKPMICKDYRAYRLPDGHTLECSIVDGGAFAYAEVEFASEEEAKNWTPISFLGRETTNERGFKMHTYWENRIVPSHAAVGK